MPPHNGRDKMKRLPPFYLTLAGLLVPAQACVGVVAPDGAGPRKASPELTFEEGKADLGDLYDQREVDQTYGHGSTTDSKVGAGLSADEDDRLSAAEEEWGDDELDEVALS